MMLVIGPNDVDDDDGLETVESSLKLDVALLEVSSNHELLSALIFAFSIVVVFCSLFVQQSCSRVCSTNAVICERV